MSSSNRTETLEKLVGFSRWIDSNLSDRDGEALTLHRIIKISEEVGETVEAVIASLGANPRKPATDGFDKVLEELLDVAVAALGAYEHVDGFRGRSLDELEGKIHRVFSRVGLELES